MPTIHSPANGLQAVLVTAGVVGGGSGWTAYCGQEMNDPDQTVTLLDSGGPAPEVAVGINYPRVQVVVRGTPNDYDGTYARALLVRKALLRLPTPNVDYPELTVVTEQTDIQSLGRDSSGRPRLSMNFRLITTPADPGYRQ